MTDVSLNEFKFALPTVVMVEENGFKSNIEYPHEFFGLTDKDQVAVLHGVLCAVQEHLNSNVKTLKESDFGPADIEQEALVGIAVLVKRTPSIKIETTFNFPKNWKKLSKASVSGVLSSISYLLQGTCIAIVRKAEAGEACNAR